MTLRDTTTTFTFFIGYKLEQTVRGWTVLRKRTGEREAVHVKKEGSMARVRYFRTTVDAYAEMETQLRQDMDAAERLGLHVERAPAVDGAVLTIDDRG